MPKISAVEESLQNTTNKLIQWAHKEGMIINSVKTKVMVFGDVIDEVKIKINDTVLENVQNYKYLGVVLLSVYPARWTDGVVVCGIGVLWELTQVMSLVCDCP